MPITCQRLRLMIKLKILLTKIAFLTKKVQKQTFNNNINIHYIT